MNIKALRAFRFTVLEGSIAAASEHLHLSQPAVSRLISGLETELNLTLFDRSGRSLTPTREGLAFYREAGRILDQLEEVPRIAGDIRSGRSEHLRIVTMPRIAQALAVPAVARVAKDNPNINISLDVRARREADKWLVGREYDVCVGALPLRHPDIRTTPILRARTLAVLPAGHYLANRYEITADDMAGERVIRLMRGLLLRDQLDDIFHSAGVTPVSNIEVAASRLACAIAASGAGITIADELVARSLGDQVVLVPIAPARWMTFGLLIARDAERTAATEMFRSALAEIVSELCGESSNLQIA